MKNTSTQKRRQSPVLTNSTISTIKESEKDGMRNIDMIKEWISNTEGKDREKNRIFRILERIRTLKKYRKKQISTSQRKIEEYKKEMEGLIHISKISLI